MLKTISIILLLTTPVWNYGQESTNNFVEKMLYQQKQKQRTLIGKFFPPFKAHLDGKNFSSSKLTSKVSLISFWFVGCRPCLLEFKGLNELNEKFKDSKDFQIISITYEKDEVIEEIKKKYGLNFGVISVTYEEFLKLLQGFGCPVNVIVDRRRIIKYWEWGGQTSEEKTTNYMWNVIYPKIKEVL